MPQFTCGKEKLSKVLAANISSTLSPNLDFFLLSLPSELLLQLDKTSTAKGNEHVRAKQEVSTLGEGRHPHSVSPSS